MEKTSVSVKKEYHNSTINLIAGCFFAAQVVTPIALAAGNKKADNKKR